MNNKKLVTVSMAFIMASSSLAMAQTSSQQAMSQQEAIYHTGRDLFLLSFVSMVVSMGTFMTGETLAMQGGEKLKGISNQIDSLNNLKRAIEEMKADANLKDVKIIDIVENPSLGESKKVNALVDAMTTYRASHDRTFSALRNLSPTDLAKLEEQKSAVEKRVNRFKRGMVYPGLAGMVGSFVLMFSGGTISKWIHSDASSGAEVMKRFAELTLTQADAVTSATANVIKALEEQGSLVR